jgi:tRNA U34 5-methylaminomethyl-2-thiouridine-forming methyltransferase MnmC
MDEYTQFSAMTLVIRPTRDGSHTLCNVAINKTYHSIHGAMQESQHVFIKAGLEPVMERKDRIHLLEIGFGTGLNALLSIQKVLEAQSQQLTLVIHYTTLEPYPIPMEIVQQLNYAQYFESPALYQSLLMQMHQAAWEEPQEIYPGFYLKKLRTRLEEFVCPVGEYDLIYFDPFPPSAQLYLWERPALTKLSAALVPGGMLTTYCAKGQVKRDLKATGLEIERLPGPPGKREMTRAVKPWQ